MSDIEVDGSGEPYFIRDPRSRLPVNIDWTAWLANEGTTIFTSTWTAPTGITLDGTGNNANVTTCYVSGGTPEQSYVIRNTITCVNGTIDSRSIRVVCRDR